MGGFGAAYRFHAEGITPVMYDKNTYHGGHTGVVPLWRLLVRSGPAHFVYQDAPHAGTLAAPKC